MSIGRLKVNNGYVYYHSWDDVEYVNPHDYIISQNCETFIIRYLPTIEYTLGKCPQWLYKGLKRVLRNSAVANLLWQLKTTDPPLAFYDIISWQLRKKEQEKRLRNLTITPEQLMSLLIYAGSQGYTLSHYSYRESINSSRGEDFQYAFMREKGDIVTNITNKTDKEIRFFLENSELINAFILDKGCNWFCLCQRKKGILGKESGKRGSIPHMHFISNSFSRKRSELVDKIRNGQCPDSSIHIEITDYI